MSEKEKDTTEQQKDVAYYTALVNAWIQTKIEHDKTLISLSAGGIGLLIAILSAVGVKHWWEILLYFGALFSFIITIAICIYIFVRNSKHIEDVLKRKTSRDYLLARLDKISSILFVFAVLFSMAIGIVTALDKLSERNVKGDVKMCY
jgi:glucan phosphoethanolaminetransferase (alkaline phosphatase superfamily)